MTRVGQLQRKAALIEYYLRTKKEEYPSEQKGQIPFLGHISRAGFEKWRNGETDAPRVLVEASNAMAKSLNIEPAHNLLGENVGVMELGKMLGLTRAECRQAIDTLTIELGPSFGRFSIDRGLAKHLLDGYRGLYRVYRIEDTREAADYTDRPLSILCMGLSVRYGVKGSKRHSRDELRIRCKLDVPAYRSIVRAHEYDGYVTPPDASSVLYWMFEARKDAEKDIVLLLTSELTRARQKDGPRQFMLGTMVSRTQETHSQAAIWPIVLERAVDLPRVADSMDDHENDAEHAFMREHAGLIDPKDVDAWVLAALKDAERFARVMPGQVT